MLRNLAKGAQAFSNKWTLGLPGSDTALLGSQPTRARAPPTILQVRHKWANWLMIKDVKRRRLNAENYTDRLRLITLAKNKILPMEIKEDAYEKLNAFPLDSTPLRINKRCAITSRPRGIVYDYRLSRMVFRHHVDYNKMSGIQRAMWGFQ